MKNKLLIGVGVCLLFGVAANADIYDDYKLIASGILINNNEIKKLKDENKILHQEIENLKKKNIRVSKMSNNKLLDDKTRIRLESIAEKK